MTAIEELASLLLIRLRVQGKPDLGSVCRQIGLRWKEVDSEGFDGVLIRAVEGPKGIVGVRQSIREYPRKRFTIAHEIGHYLIPSHKTLPNVCPREVIESWNTERLNPAEVEANQFAAELLLPTRLVRQALATREPSMHTIRTVANEFETSLTATTSRFLDLTDLPCALIWSEDGRAKWYKRSIAFPFFLPKEDLPCKGSFADVGFSGGSVPNDLTPVEPTLWLDRRDAEGVHQLLEHSVSLRMYNAVLSFLWIRSMNPNTFGHEREEPETALEELDPEEFTLRRKKWPR